MNENAHISHDVCSIVYIYNIDDYVYYIYSSDGLHFSTFIFIAGTFIRYLSVVLMSIMMFLYIAEAISIDILLYREDTREEGFPLPCFNLTRNYSDTNM